MANVQGDINNYDIQVKVCVRNGTPTFELINVVGNNAQATGSIMSAAPKEITDKIMKSFYPSRGSAAVPPPPPNPSKQEIQINTEIARIKALTGYNKDKYDKKIDEIRSLYIRDGTSRNYLNQELAKIKSSNDFTSILMPMATSRGGRRTRRVTTGNRNKKTQSNRAKHTFSFNLF
jgi:hypothetical protein